MQAFIDQLPSWVLVHINKLTQQQILGIVNILFGAFLIAAVLFSIYCFLRGMGWVRYQGRWYSSKQFQLIVQELYSGVKDGRVPDYDTMKILDRYVYGPKGSTIRNMTRSDHI